MTNRSEFILTQPEELSPIEFPYALRGDGLVNNYLGPAGDIYLEPKDGHDFAFSDRLIHDGLSSGKVVERDQKPHYLRYNGGSDLISLPAILNSSINLENGGAEDISQALALTGQLLSTCHKIYGVVPAIDAIDGVAFDRMAGRAELLPPYHTRSDLRASDVIEHLKRDTLRRAQTSKEVEVLKHCFEHALDILRGE